MGFSLFKDASGKCRFLCAGDDGSEPTVKSTFTQDVQNITNILNEMTTEVQMQLDIEATASNKSVIMNVKADGAGSEATVTSKQKAEVNANVALSMLLETIINSAYSAKEKLDLIDTVSQIAKNSATELQGNSSSASEQVLKISNQTNLTNIQRLTYSLAYCFSVASSNDLTVMNVIATNGGKATVTVEQTTKAAINVVNDIINDNYSGLTADEIREFKEELKTMQETESTGTPAKIADSISKFFDQFKIAGIAIIAVPIIIIIAIIALIFVFVLRKPKKEVEYQVQPQQEQYYQQQY